MSFRPGHVVTRAAFKQLTPKWFEARIDTDTRLVFFASICESDRRTLQRFPSQMALLTALQKGDPGCAVNTPSLYTGEALAYCFLLTDTCSLLIFCRRRAKLGIPPAAQVCLASSSAYGKSC